MPQRLVLPPIPADQRTPLVEALLGIIEMQAERIQRQDEKKTCRKLRVSFWDYLNDRIGCTGLIPPLPDPIVAAAAA